MRGTPVIYNLQAVPRGTLFPQNRRFAHGLQPGKQAKRCGTIFSSGSHWGCLHWGCLQSQFPSGPTLLPAGGHTDSSIPGYSRNDSDDRCVLATHDLSIIK